MAIIAVLRHSPYSSTENIGDDNRELAIERGKKLIDEMGIAGAVDSILIVSSSAPRAIQTAESLRTGLGIAASHPIHTTEFLYDDVTHTGDIPQALAFIEQLPTPLFLIVVTHKDFVIGVARSLGHHATIPREILDLTDGGVECLQGLVFNTDQEVSSTKEVEPKMHNGEPPKEMYSEYEFPIPQGKRAFDIVRIISSLQSQKGTWQKIADTDGSEHQFLVPLVLPNVDPEDAMNGTYDRKGTFSIKVKYDPESDLSHAGKHKDIPTLSQFQALEWIFGELDDMHFPF